MNAEILTREKTGEAEATTVDPGLVAGRLPAHPHEATIAETTATVVAAAAAADPRPEETTDETAAATAGDPRPGAEAGNTGEEGGPLRMILLPLLPPRQGPRLMFPQGHLQDLHLPDAAEAVAVQQSARVQGRGQEHAPGVERGTSLGTGRLQGLGLGPGRGTESGLGMIAAALARLTASADAPQAQAKRVTARSREAGESAVLLEIVPQLAPRGGVHSQMTKADERATGNLPVLQTRYF